MMLQVDPPKRVVGRALARDLAAEVEDLHLAFAQQPIVGPDEYGCFQISPLVTVPPLVAAANVLDRDLMRAARKDERTVLVNTANSGVIRIFCAQHVLDEVPEHAPRLAQRAGVSLEKYLRVWQENYVPLLRLVDVPEGLLAADEAERIALLDHGPDELRDPDDVPSATLALQLGAVLLSTDKKALRAVYGRDVDLTLHHAWLDLLKLGGDAGALAEMKSEGGLGQVGLVRLALAHHLSALRPTAPTSRNSANPQDLPNREQWKTRPLRSRTQASRQIQQHHRAEHARMSVTSTDRRTIHKHGRLVPGLSVPRARVRHITSMLDFNVKT